MAWMDQSANLVDAVRISTCRLEPKESNWAIFHEVGHNHQSPDWTFDGTEEVTVNLFTLHTFEFLCGIVATSEAWSDRDRFRAELIASYDFSDPDFEQWKNDPALALVMYEQMQEEFGWEAYRSVFATYRALPDTERPRNDDEKRDQWLVRFSRQVGRNLGPFFEAWGVPTSRAARDSIADLPAWLPSELPVDTNLPPHPVGTLTSLRIEVDDPAPTVDVTGAFRDPDGDALTYAATSSASGIAAVAVSGGAVTLTPVATGTATITVTATDTSGSNTAATQAFTVEVVRLAWTDDPIRPGVTAVKAIHFTELRSRIEWLRQAAGLQRFTWTDPVLTVGATRIGLVHLLDLRAALAEAFTGTSRAVPDWTDPAPVAGTTPVRAAHLMELRAAVMALESVQR